MRDRLHAAWLLAALLLATFASGLVPGGGAQQSAPTGSVDGDDGWLRCEGAPDVISQPWNETWSAIQAGEIEASDATNASVDLSSWCPSEVWNLNGLFAWSPADWVRVDMQNMTLIADPSNVSEPPIEAQIWLVRNDTRLGWSVDAIIEVQWQAPTPSNGTLRLERVRPAGGQPGEPDEVVHMRAVNGALNLSGWTLHDRSDSWVMPDLWLGVGDWLVLEPGAVRHAAADRDWTEWAEWADGSELGDVLPGLADAGDSLWLTSPDGALADGVGWGAAVEGEPTLERLTAGSGDLTRWDGRWWPTLVPDGELGTHWWREPASSAPDPDGTTVGVSQADLCVVPHGCGGMWLDAVREADDSLLLAVYQFTSAPLAAALIEAAEDGRQVRVIVDRLPVGWTDTPDPTEPKHSEQAAQRVILAALVDAGAEVRWYDGPGHLHAKLLLADRDHAVIGSENWKPSSTPWLGEGDDQTANRGHVIDLASDGQTTPWSELQSEWSAFWNAGTEWNEREALSGAPELDLSPASIPAIEPMRIPLSDEHIDIVSGDLAWGGILESIAGASERVDVQLLHLDPEWALPGHRADGCPAAALMAADPVLGSLDLSAHLRGGCVVLSPVFAALIHAAVGGAQVSIQLDPTRMTDADHDHHRVAAIVDAVVAAGIAPPGRISVSLDLPPGVGQLHAKAIAWDGHAYSGSVNPNLAGVHGNVEAGVVVDGLEPNPLATWIANDTAGTAHPDLAAWLATDPASAGPPADHAAAEDTPWPALPALIATLLIAGLLPRRNSLPPPRVSPVAPCPHHRPDPPERRTAPRTCHHPTWRH